MAVPHDQSLKLKTSREPVRHVHCFAAIFSRRATFPKNRNFQHPQESRTKMPLDHSDAPPSAPIILASPAHYTSADFPSEYDNSSDAFAESASYGEAPYGYHPPTELSSVPCVLDHATSSASLPSFDNDHGDIDATMDDSFGGGIAGKVIEDGSAGTVSTGPRRQSVAGLSPISPTSSFPQQQNSLATVTIPSNNPESNLLLSPSSMTRPSHPSDNITGGNKLAVLTAATRRMSLDPARFPPSSLNSPLSPQHTDTLATAAEDRDADVTVVGEVVPGIVGWSRINEEPLEVEDDLERDDELDTSENISSSVYNHVSRSTVDV
ncbi:hypothetical protein DFS34DRAFT_58137 [Phlyctochytrium arcticum]|nr:hypothetical protein DFS34DRAFT_58137 [Phlyctochytrium arcticum]